MKADYIVLTPQNLETEHLCCAISDKKHQAGVQTKKAWLKERLNEGHVFRKLDVQGKVFIEYAPLENAWVPVIGEGYFYIYCLWVSGSYKGKGYGKELLTSCIADARSQGKSGVCAISSKKKKPFLSDKVFLEKNGFKAVDTVGDDYVLMALCFDTNIPGFTESVKRQRINNTELVIYYGMQCPYIPDCITQIEKYCGINNIPVTLISVDTKEKAKSLPCIFNNWVVFFGGRFQTVHLLNEGYLRKLLGGAPVRDKT